MHVQLLSTGAVLYMLRGGGGSSIVLVREQNVVLIDSKPRGRTQELVEAVSLVTERPITTIINTHAHLDHTGGNLDVPGVVEIIAHERARAAMQQMEAFTGPGAKFLPNKTVGDKMSLFEGRDRIDLYYFGAGHTDGDLVVVLPEHNIAYLGDLFPAKARAPRIDPAHGGSGVAFPDTLDRVVREIKGITRVVTGHDPGPPPDAPRNPYGHIQSWDDLRQYAEFNRDFLAAVRSAAAQGKSAAEAAASLALPAKYSGYDMTNAKANVEIIFKELSASKPAR
jgi:glyoxylase-like metal-dependent hydrolase (beta-lactamase superfamily II)